MSRPSWLTFIITAILAVFIGAFGLSALNTAEAGGGPSNIRFEVTPSVKTSSGSWTDTVSYVRSVESVQLLKTYWYRYISGGDPVTYTFGPEGSETRMQGDPYGMYYPEGMYLAYPTGTKNAFVSALWHSTIDGCDAPRMTISVTNPRTASAVAKGTVDNRTGRYKLFVSENNGPWVDLPIGDFYATSSKQVAEVRVSVDGSADSWKQCARLNWNVTPAWIEGTTPTPSPTVTSTPTSTATPRPTITATPSPTPSPTASPTAAPKITSVSPTTVKPGDVITITGQNFLHAGVDVNSLMVLLAHKDGGVATLAAVAGYDKDPRVAKPNWGQQSINFKVGQVPDQSGLVKVVVGNQFATWAEEVIIKTQPAPTAQPTVKVSSPNTTWRGASWQRVQVNVNSATSSSVSFTYKLGASCGSIDQTREGEGITPYSNTFWVWVYPQKGACTVSFEGTNKTSGGAFKGTLQVRVR